LPHKKGLKFFFATRAVLSLVKYAEGVVTSVSKQHLKTLPCKYFLLWLAADSF